MRCFTIVQHDSHKRAGNPKSVEGVGVEYVDTLLYFPLIERKLAREAFTVG